MAENKIMDTELKGQYVTQKTKDLRKFGYPDLTTDEVKVQLEKALAGEQLDVIGMFIQADLKDAGLIGD